MILIQRGTTASRANRGKSVNRSITQTAVEDSYEGKSMMGSLMQMIGTLPYP